MRRERKGFEKWDLVYSKRLLQEYEKLCKPQKRGYSYRCVVGAAIGLLFLSNINSFSAQNCFTYTSHSTTIYDETNKRANKRVILLRVMKLLHGEKNPLITVVEFQTKKGD